MRRIQFALALILGGLSGLWILAAVGVAATHPGASQWRVLAMQSTGVLAFGAMSIAILLALRPGWLESLLGGLDRMYRLHRWLGIAALAFAVMHWFAEDLFDDDDDRHAGRGRSTASALARLLSAQHHFASEVGDFLFNAFVVLVAVALVRRFPYRWFARTHRLLAVAYLGLAYHALVLLEFAYWTEALGAVTLALATLGAVAAVRVLAHRVAERRKTVGEVERVERFEALGVVEVTLLLRGRWPGHVAGQFAFLTLHPDEGPHPFTIASAWQNDGRIMFIIKGLGDYTRTLPGRLQVGDVAIVEGPYGRFNFEGRARRQVWVGAGIGITPFIARMKQLVEAPDGRTIDLFHPTSVHDAEAIGLLERDAQAAGVRLHINVSGRDERLDARRIAAVVPDWKDADFWFCGPAAFGETLERDLVSMGLPRARFHRELFELR